MGFGAGEGVGGAGGAGEGGEGHDGVGRIFVWVWLCMYGKGFVERVRER